jgi:hypothetical protein
MATIVQVLLCQHRAKAAQQLIQPRKTRLVQAGEEVAQAIAIKGVFAREGNLSLVLKPISLHREG